MMMNLQNVTLATLVERLGGNQWKQKSMVEQERKQRFWIDYLIIGNYEYPVGVIYTHVIFTPSEGNYHARQESRTVFV